MSAYEFVQRGKVLIVKKQYQDAVRVCRLGLLAHPGLVDGRLVLGMALMELGRYDEVLAEMRVALDLDKDSPLGHLLKGEALLRKGDARQAFEVLSRAKELDPLNEKVTALLEEARQARDASRRAALRPPPDGFADPSETKLYPAHRGRSAPADTGDSTTGSVTVPGKSNERLSEWVVKKQVVKLAVPPKIRVGSSAPTASDPEGPSTIELDPSVDAEEISPEDEAEAARVAGIDDVEVTGTSSIELASKDIEELPGEPTAFGPPAGLLAETDEASFPDDESVVSLDDEEGRAQAQRMARALSELERESRAELGAALSAAADDPTAAASPVAARKSRAYEDSSTGDTSPASPIAAARRAADNVAGERRVLLYDDDELESTSPSPADPPLVRRSGAFPGGPMPSAARGAASLPAGAPSAARGAASLPAGAPSAARGAASPPAGAPSAARGAASPLATSASPTEGSGGPGFSPGVGPPSPRGSPDALREPARGRDRVPARPGAGSSSVEPAASDDLTGRMRRQHAQMLARAAVPPPRRAASPLLLSLVAAAVVAAAVGAGLVVREARLKRRLRQLTDEALRVAATQTYRGYLQAETYFRTILAERPDPAVRAALLRIRAALAVEFGEPSDEAKRLYAEVGDESGRDATLARVYLALASGERGEATRAARDAAARFPQDAEASYLLGLALLGEDDAAGAAQELEKAAAMRPAPLTYVALGVAEAARGRHAAARQALDKALEIVPGHPSATIERVRLLAATDDPSIRDERARELESALDAILRAGQATPGTPAIVSRAQVGWASLALAELRVARGDEAGAKAALASARAVRPGRDLRFAEALVAALLLVHDISGARKEAERAAGVWPQRGTPHVWLAKVALAEGKPDLAQAHIDKAGAAGARPAALALRGQAKLLLGDIDGAARDLDEAHAALPDDRAILVARAGVDLRRGDPRSAIARVEPLYQVRPDPEVAVVLGAALRMNGDRARAKQILEEAARSPRGAAAHLELARLHREEGRYVEARASYARAIEVSPRRADARLEAATLMFDLGDAVGAREALDKLAEEAPGEPEVLLEAARIRTMTGDHAGAEKKIEDAARLPTAARWKVNRERGRLLLAQRHAAAAAKELALATSLYPDDGETRLLLIDAHTALGDSAAAQAALAEVLKRFHGKPEADLARGRIHLANVRLPQAVAAFDAAHKALKARAAPPRVVADARTWLGRALYYQGDLAKAQAAFEDAARLDPSSFQAHYLLGQVLYERNQLQAAKAAFERAIQNDPTMADAFFYLGDAAFRLKDKAAARMALEKYLQLAPKGDFAAEARKLLR